MCTAGGLLATHLTPPPAADTTATPLRYNKTLQESCAKALGPECGEVNVIPSGELCEPPSTGGWHPPVSYRFWAGSQSFPVFVRKHDEKEQYLIVASVQPQSNQIGNSPDAANITIELDGAPVRFEARRQGSVYVLDKTTGGANGTLTQVDTWHQVEHPSYWSSNFDFEAEMHAGLASDSALTLHTRTELAEGAQHPLDFAGSTSYVTASAETPLLRYHWEPRGTRVVEYVVWVRIREIGGTSVLAIALDGKQASEKRFGGGGDRGFCWTRFDQMLAATPEPHTLSLRLGGGSLHVDAIRLVRADKGDAHEAGRGTPARVDVC